MPEQESLATDIELSKSQGRCHRNKRRRSYDGVPHSNHAYCEERTGGRSWPF